MAIVHKPKLVVLDEPTNGLDPGGINHIRGLIQDLNRKDGVTFVISSHLLHEIEITCNRVAIIKEGRVVVQDTIGALLAKTGAIVRVEAEPREKAKELLSKRGTVTETEDGALVVQVEPSVHAAINAELVGAGLSVRCFSPRRITLEEYFLAQ